MTESLTDCTHKALGKFDINLDCAECLDCGQVISGLELVQSGINTDTLEPIEPSNEQNIILC